MLDSNDEDTEKEYKCDGIRSLVGGFLVEMVLGNQNTWGNISLYCSSYFGGKYPSPLALFLPIFLFLKTVFLPVSGMIVQHISIKTLIAMALCVICSVPTLVSFI